MKKLADLADLAVFMDLGLVPNCSMLSKVLVLARRGGGVGQARRWRWQVLKWLGYSKLYLSGQGVESGKYL